MKSFHIHMIEFYPYMIFDKKIISVSYIWFQFTKKISKSSYCSNSFFLNVIYLHFINMVWDKATNMIGIKHARHNGEHYTKQTFKINKDLFGWFVAFVVQFNSYNNMTSIIMKTNSHSNLLHDKQSWKQYNMLLLTEMNK